MKNPDSLQASSEFQQTSLLPVTANRFNTIHPTPKLIQVVFWGRALW